MKRVAVILLSGLLLAFLPANAATTHTVKGGDSLEAIARRYGVTVDAIAKANQLTRPDAITVGQKLVIPTAAPAGKTYVVEEGDTLGSIAYNLKTTQEKIAALNKLADPDNLSVGQTLVIPQGEAPVAPTGTSIPALSPALKKQLDAIPVKPGRWRYIVIHHSATAQGSARSMDAYHRRRGMENGLAYHFVIGNGRGTGDGVIEVGNRWRRQIKGGHLASDRLNEVSIGICLVGNYNNTRPTKAQMQSLRAITHYLMLRSRNSSSAVKLHKQINTKPTECPGRQFPASQLMQGL